MKTNSRTRSTLSAREAADQIATARSSDNLPVKDQDELFTCRDCGCHRFIFAKSFTRVTTIRDTVACRCGESLSGLAYEQTRTVSQNCWATGYLNEEHRVDWEQEDSEEIDSDVLQQDVHCESCYRDWREERDSVFDTDPLEDTDVESFDEEYVVSCADCEHEIEFSWSHPNRGGRIWPCESSDHNPWLAWPEPRFRDDWKRRGWLRPV